MNTITSKEITQLYKKCRLNSSYEYKIRTDINTGTLDNKLNTNYNFSDKIMPDVATNYYNAKLRK